MRIMITGGGTGGHTSPAVAIIEELFKRDPQLALQWIGRRGGIEQRVCANLRLPFRAIPTAGWPRSNRIRQAWAGLAIAAGCLKSAALIKQFQPQLVLGVGGYVSVPLVWTAQRMGIPTVLHEQNKRLGMANRLLARRANKILLSYPDTIGDYPAERARVAGNPVRAGFANPPDRETACSTLQLDSALPVVLVIGGSQGATTLNRAMTDVLGMFSVDEAQFLWMTGHDAAPQARAAANEALVRADVFAYIDDMVTACAAADLIVSRAGASSTAEIAMLGKPSILVPYPHATDQHQDANARAFEEAGAAMVIPDSECGAKRLASAIRELLGNPARLKSMADAARSLARPVAVEDIVEEIFSLVAEPS